MIRLSFYLFFTLAISFEAFSQEKEYKYPLPVGLNYTQLKIKDSPQKSQDSCLSYPLKIYEDTLDYLGCLNKVTIDYFYPIGWSKEGAFAYAQLVDIDGELPTYKIHIIDWVLSSEKGLAVGFTPSEDYGDFEDFWTNNQLNVNYLMENHVILPNTIKFRPIKGFSTSETNGFAIQLIPKRTNLPYGEKGTFIHEYQLKLIASKNDERLINKYEYTGSPMKIADISIAGIIESPFQKKAILVLTVKEWVQHAGKNLRFKLVVVNW